MKKIAVFGIGISGKSIVDYLIKSNHGVIAIDDKKESLDNLLSNYKDQPRLLQKIDICFDQNKINWSDVEFLVISPGVPLKYPKPHNIVELAKKNNCKIIGDVELFYMLHKNANFIGITGTNGKSTTTSLTGHIFKKCDINSSIGGNIGIAVFDLKESDNYIFEMSSYQLDLSDKTRFNIAAILNITPDHLDRHGDMDGYIAAKTRIFLNQGQNDVLILNIDDENCLNIYKNLKKDLGYKGRIVAISTKTNQDDAIFVKNGQITNNFSKKTINLPDFKHLKGNHNCQNIAFAYAISYFSNIDDGPIINAIESFEGLRHRLQFVDNVKNINFINDSKATNVESVLCALEAYDNIFWIAGGELKSDDLSMLIKYLPKIEKAFLIGKGKEKIANFLNEHNIENHVCDKLDVAFNNAAAMALKESNNINILLSPACSSFDQFKNFEERGDVFCQLVEGFNNECK